MMQIDCQSTIWHNVFYRCLVIIEVCPVGWRNSRNQAAPIPTDPFPLDKLHLSTWQKKDCLRQRSTMCASLHFTATCQTCEWRFTSGPRKRTLASRKWWYAWQSPTKTLQVKGKTSLDSAQSSRCTHTLTSQTHLVASRLSTSWLFETSHTGMKRRPIHTRRMAWVSVSMSHSRPEEAPGTRSTSGCSATILAREWGTSKTFGLLMLKKHIYFYVNSTWRFTTLFETKWIIVEDNCLNIL